MNAYEATLREAMEVARKKLPPMIAACVAASLEDYLETPSDPDIGALLTEIASLDGCEKVAAEMREYVGKRVDMRWGEDEEDEAGGTVDAVQVDVYVHLDWGYSVPATTDGFSIKEAEAETTNVDGD